MRNLTLDEKITIKGKLAVKGVIGVPGLTMKSALHYWRMCYGWSIALYYKGSYYEN